MLMQTRHGSPRENRLWGIVAIAVFLFVDSACAQSSLTSPSTLEFIRVSADRWTFEGASSGTRFIPFGSNLVWHYPSGQDKAQGLDILVRSPWDPAAVRRAFEAASALHMNVLKVFLPSHLILRDPQSNDHVVLAEMEPALLDRLDYLFQTARETNVYVSLAFAEWGMHKIGRAHV